MVKNILAIVAGLAAAFATVWFIQLISQYIYPLPAGLDINDGEQLAAHVAGAPIPALLLVLASYFLGTVIGIKVANWIAPMGALRNALIIGGLMLVATITNLVMIPHPMWFSVAAVGGIVLLAWLVTMRSRSSA